MQVRLDPDIAAKVKRNAKAHERLFKRRKSYSAEVNELLRCVLFENGVSVPIKLNRPARLTP